MMKSVLNKSIKIIIISFLILFSLINLISIKHKDIGYKLMNLNHSAYYYGDLYELSKLSSFKDHIYVDNTPYENPSIEDTDILTMGDSFFESNLETMRLPHLLAKESNKKVYHLSRNDFLSYNDNPIEFLRKIGYKKTTEKKYLVLETTERYALERSSTLAESIFLPTTVETPAKVETPEATAPSPKEENTINQPKGTPITTLKVFAKKVLNKFSYVSTKAKGIIDSNSLQYFFYNNKLVSPLSDMAKDFRFKFLKETDWRTPKYSKNPEMLFYLEDINFSSLNITDETVGIYANNIKLIRDYLLKEYNLELVYVVIPTKYSIYGEHVENSKPYNNFIPRAVKAMERYNINTFDSYTLYKDTLKNSSEPLYFRGDSHFTSKGKDLILKEIEKLIK